MASLIEKEFIDGIIADKIGISKVSSLWAATMGQDLYVFSGTARRKYLLQQTFRSPICFSGEQLVRCHDHEINLLQDEVIKVDFSSCCKNVNNDVAISDNHSCTNVAWSDKGVALASFRFFKPRNGQRSSTASMNYLVAISNNEVEGMCRKLAEHSYMTFDCTAAARRFLAAYGEKLQVWDDLHPVRNSFPFSTDLAIDYIFFVEDEARMIGIDAAGKVFEIYTNNWTVENSWVLENYSSGNLVAISPDAVLVATGNNNGNCYIYRRSEKGYKLLLVANFKAIITAIAINNSNELVVGLNGAGQRGTGIYTLPGFDR